jgi:PAS domain S-box-containing protein
MNDTAITGLLIPDLSIDDESVFLLDSNGHILDHHTTLQNMFPIPDEQLSGAKMTDLLGREGSSLLLDAIDSLHLGSTSALFRFTFYTDEIKRNFRVRCHKMLAPGSDTASHGYLLTLKDETAERTSALKYENQFEMHKLITRIATDFVNISADKLSGATERALAEIGRFTGADRVYICTYDYKKQLVDNTYEWCADDISPEIANLQRIPFDHYAGFTNAHTRGEILYIPDTSTLTPGSSTKNMLEMQGIKSVLTIPMIINEECLGFVGLDSVLKVRSWDDNEVQVLKLFSDLLANTESRARNEKKLQQSENRHRALLTALPDIIFRVTDEGEFLDIYSADPTELLLPAEKIIGSNIRDIVPEETARIFFEHIDRLIKTRERSEFEYKFEIDGEVRHFEARAVRIEHNEHLFVVRNISELVESLERIEQITQNIPGAIYTFRFRPDGLMEMPYISNGIQELTGQTVSEVQENLNLFWDRVHPDYIQGLRESIQESAEKMSKWQYEFRLKDAEDRWIWIQAASTPRKMEDGTILWYGYLRDFTRNREMEESLEYEREMMNILMDTFPDQIYFKDRKSRFIRINRATANRFGFEDPEAMIGKTDEDFFDRFHADNALQCEQEIIRSGVPVLGLEEKEVWPDGSITWASTTKMPLYNKDRVIIGTFGISRDITQRKNDDQKLKKREAYLTAVIENQNGYIWLKDLDGRFVLVNSRFANACNIESPEMMIGKTEDDINDHGRANKYILEDQKVIRTGKTLITQEKIVRNGKDIWIETYKSPVIDQKGEVIGTTGYALEITDRKKKVEQVRKLNEQLKGLNTQKDKLFSILAHDLRNPFAGSLGMLEMILQDRSSITDEEMNEYIRLLYENLMTTYNLIENLLEWSRTQRKKMTHAPEHFDLPDIIGQTFSVVSTSATDKQISLTHDVPPGTGVFADRDMLHAILRNLITNGIKFTKPGGQITVSAKQKNKMMEITVADTGIGIRAEEQEKLFMLDYEPSSKGTWGEKGTGLGLQICKEFVELHGGRISVESEPGRGSIFRFTIPVKRK